MKWNDGHPKEDGLYWLSAAPKAREPNHWEHPELPRAWLVQIKDEFCHTLTPGMKSYPLSDVVNPVGVIKYAVATFRLPADPWKVGK